MINVVIGALSDGFSAIGIGINLFVGALYSVGSAWSNLVSKFTWGEVKQEAIANMQSMQAKAEEYYQKASDGAMNFKSKTVEAYNEIGKTQEQKNADTIANNQKTLDELKAQEDKHITDYKAISDQRIQLEQQLLEARKTGNQASIDLATKGLADLEAKEKAYQAESQKILDEKIKAAQDWANAQLTAVDGTQKAMDIVTQKTIQSTLATQGLKVEYDSAGKAIVTAMTNAKESIVSLSTQVAAGRKGAQDLGFDLDIALNKVSEGFKAKEASFKNVANSIELMGVKGKQAGDVIYQAWVKWLETAKSQTEVDYAKAKLQEFGTQGKLSTQQVEFGMQAIRQVVQKLPDDLDPVEQAFERLGIKTKEQLKLAAQSALADFNTIQSSGQATAESLRQAYERLMQAAAASGDQAVMSSAQSKAASLGLSVQVDETGKATVQSYDEMNKAAMSHASTVSSGVTSAYREMGAVAREEAKNSIDAWNEAMNLKSDAQAKARDEDSKNTHAVSSTSYTKSYVRDELKKMGYEDGQAEKISQSIFGTALAKDQDVLQKNRSLGGATDISSMLYQELRKKGLAGYDGSRYIEQALQRYSDGKGQTSVAIPAPNVYSNNGVSQALSSDGNNASKTVQYNLNFGGKTLNLSGSSSQEATLNELLKQLETINKSS